MRPFRSCSSIFLILVGSCCPDRQRRIPLPAPRRSRARARRRTRRQPGAIAGVVMDRPTPTCSSATTTSSASSGTSRRGSRRTGSCSTARGRSAAESCSSRACSRSSRSRCSGIGSPQLFQTGESYQMGPLIDRQHPHDLLMELGATYRLRASRATIILSDADLVGPAALGPTPFMHRESARNNPQAPLTHHQLDSTHITPGVLTGGVEVGQPDASGIVVSRTGTRREPAGTSAGRGSIPGRCRGSGVMVRGRLRCPAASCTSRNGSSRTTSRGSRRRSNSTEHVRSHPVAATLAWGENREIHGILDGYLFEWERRRHRARALLRTRGSRAKDLLDLGFPDPPGFVSFHRISHVAAVDAWIPPRHRATSRGDVSASAATRRSITCRTT